MSDPNYKSNLTQSLSAVNSLKDSLDGIKAMTNRELVPAMDHLGQSMSNVFVKAARDGKISAEEIGRSFLSMAKKILEQQVFSKLGPFGNILGGLIGGLAGGGTIQPNKPTLVGERGPELFIPNSSGRVANNHEMGRGMGGAVTIHQTINIEPSTQKDLIAMIHAARPMMREDAKRAVMDAMNGIRF